MKVNKKQASFILKKIQEWKSSDVLDDTTALRMQESLEIIPFDFKKLAKYSFWISVSCMVAAVISFFADDVLRRFIEKLFNTSHVIKFLLFSFFSIVIYLFTFLRRQRKPDLLYSHEALFAVASFIAIGSFYQLGMMIDSGKGHFSLLLLLAFGVYAFVAFLLQTSIVWICSLLALGAWLGFETVYMSKWEPYFLGMNYPMRFVFLGLVLTLGAFLLKKYKRGEQFYLSSLFIGLLYLFGALWALSIFGNYGDLYSWHQVKQWELLHWSLLLALVSGISLFHGLKQENILTKNFGIIFILLNLYTRFFEYFWNTWHKAFFFSVLGLSFWLLGRKAEKIFNYQSIGK